MGTRLAQLINVCIEKNIPFVSFRLPNESKIITWVQRSGKFNFVEQFNEISNQSGFVYAPFHRNTNFPLVFFEPELIFENEGFEDTLISEISEKDPLYPEYSFETPFEISKLAYLNQAENLINSFDESLTKTVLSRIQIENKPAGFRGGDFFNDLQSNYPTDFCHIINIPGAGTWTGATPETLLRVNGNLTQTISLAGTQAFRKGQISWHKKEIEEQQIVTKYVEDVLLRFQIKEFEKKKVQNLRAANVVHLASKFRFDKSKIDKQLGEFVSTLHPTPAVCGFPKKEALDLIFQTEKHNREYYAGFCGPINMENKTDLFVNLRCMKILKNKLALFLGGGLTAKSIPESEWEETVLKAKTILSIL